MIAMIIILGVFISPEDITAPLSVTFITMYYIADDIMATFFHENHTVSILKNIKD